MGTVEGRVILRRQFRLLQEKTTVKITDNKDNSLDCYRKRNKFRLLREKTTLKTTVYF
jgi:hypothetical protein